MAGKRCFGRVRLIRRNPCRIKGAGQEDSPERPVVPVASLTELLDRVPVRYRAMLLLATFAGLRFGELAALHREDIDLEHCCVRVVRSLVQTDDGRLIDAEPKSRAGRRLVSFPREIAPELCWHLDRFAPLRETASFSSAARAVVCGGRISGASGSRRVMRLACPVCTCTTFALRATRWRRRRVRACVS